MAEALPGTVTVAGLTRQLGGSVTPVVGVTWQVRSTVPLNRVVVPTVMMEAEVPPWDTAGGENDDACRVKVPWAKAADGKASKAIRQRAVTLTLRKSRLPASALRLLPHRTIPGRRFGVPQAERRRPEAVVREDSGCNDWGCDDWGCNDSVCIDSDFTMSRFRFK